MDLRLFIHSEIEKTRYTIDAILQDQTLLLAVEKISLIAAEAIKNGNKIMFCGNGGSAADSQHLAAELISKLYNDRPALPAIALTTDTSALTAIGNDYGYEKVFARQVEGLGQKGDVLIGISTSGRSPNVLQAIKSANRMGLVTIGFLGEDGRDIGEIVNHKINIPSSSTPKIQEAHIIIGHIFCAIIEQQIFFKDQWKQLSSQEALVQE